MKIDVREEKRRDGDITINGRVMRQYHAVRLFGELVVKASQHEPVNTSELWIVIHHLEEALMQLSRVQDQASSNG